MKLRNLTPHLICIMTAEGMLKIPPEPVSCTVSCRRGHFLYLHGYVHIWSPPEYTEVKNLPEPEEGVLLIVPMLVAQQVKRLDVVYPGTGPEDWCIREDGQITAVRVLIRSV